MGEAILQKLEEYTKTEVIRFELEEEEAGIFDSKIGGAYYVAKDRKPPVDEETNRPMYLLAQVNFGEIPRIEPFPEKGLLQIFISSEDMYGCDFDDPYNQKSWRIDYYEELPASVDASCIYESEWEEDEDMADELMQWVRDIFLIIISLSFFQILLPESSLEKYLKFIFSLIILAVILEPVIRLQ